MEPACSQNTNKTGNMRVTVICMLRLLTVRRHVPDTSSALHQVVAPEPRLHLQGQCVKGVT